MIDWDEIRTAYEVARHGTVSGAPRRWASTTPPSSATWTR
jgi:hypothetical protein